MTRATLTEVESRVAGCVDRDGLVEATQRLVRLESWAGNETPAQELMVELMGDAGLDVDAWDIDLPAVQAHPDCSYEIERASALGVVGSLEGRGGGRTLLLNGHVDVVPPGDRGLWTYEPFGGVVTDGRIHGRGALDMKGPLLAGLYAMRAIRDGGAELAGTVRLQSVVGEEDGGIGTLACLLRGYRGDGAIVMEPTDLAVAPVQAGCQNFRVRVRGLASHGAIRGEGVSAFEKLFDVYHAILELEAERNASVANDPLFSRYAIPFPISIGTMSGGDWASSVPDHVAMEGRMGVMPGEEMAAARRDLEQAVGAAAERDAWLRDNPPRVEWWGGRFLPARTPVDHPLTTCLQGAAASVLGRPVPLEGVPYGADAGLIVQVGQTPTVIFGAGDIRRAHRPDECVDIEELVTMSRALAVAALRFCGIDGPHASVGGR